MDFTDVDIDTCDECGWDVWDHSTRCSEYVAPKKVPFHICNHCGYETDTARCGLPCV